MINDDFFNIDDEFESLETNNDNEKKIDNSDEKINNSDKSDKYNLYKYDLDENIKENDKINKQIKAKDIKKEYKRGKQISEDYKKGKIELKDSVDELKGNINSMLDTILEPNDMFMQPDLLPSIDANIEVFDYIQEIEIIKIDSKDTLQSIANLYLDENLMKNKNIYTIIKNDADTLSDLNFSISMSKRALISCMKQLDMGVNDPDMYASVSMFQKELRESIKAVYDLQKKMKEFYKDLKSEIPEINSGVEEITEDENEKDNYTIIGDPKLINDVLDQYKNDPTLLKQNKKKDANK